LRAPAFPNRATTNQPPRAACNASAQRGPLATSQDRVNLIAVSLRRRHLIATLQLGDAVRRRPDVGADVCQHVLNKPRVLLIIAARRLLRRHIRLLPRRGVRLSLTPGQCVPRLSQSHSQTPYEANATTVTPDGTEVRAFARIGINPAQVALTVNDTEAPSAIVTVIDCCVLFVFTTQIPGEVTANVAAAV
jgi:hypothetical protein